MKLRIVIFITLLLFCISVSFSSKLEKNDMAGIFPELEGWLKKGDPEIYTEETLFEYINGAAEVFLSYDFQKLASQTYENKKKNSIIADVYLHSDSRNGFGIYSAEKPEEGDFMKIGTQAYYEKGILNFLKGRYYIKITGFDLGDHDKSLLTSIAKKLEKKLEGSLQFPDTVKKFPEKGKIKNSEKFILKNFLGYSYLSSAFLADYLLSDNKFQLFIIEGEDREECEKMLKRYLKSTKYKDDVKEGRFSIKDPYHGEIELFWKEAYICGVTGLKDAKLRIQYINLLKKNF